MSTKKIVLTALVILIFLWLIKILNISYPLTIVNTTKVTELAVVGEAKVEATPDTAYIDAGISVNNKPTVSATQDVINQVNNKIIQALKKLGIEKSNIKTSNYSIDPNYDYEGDADKITGYNGNVTVTIKTKKIELASQIIEVTTKAGANQVEGVRFSIDEPDKFREQARVEAIANARKQAQKLAKSLGIKLGRVVNIIEASPESSPLLYRSAAAEPGLGGAGPVIEPGSQTITSIVTLYFEKR